MRRPSAGVLMALSVSMHGRFHPGEPTQPGGPIMGAKGAEPQQARQLSSGGRAERGERLSEWSVDGQQQRADPYPDCKCEVKGSCKKVRFAVSSSRAPLRTTSSLECGIKGDAV